MDEVVRRNRRAWDVASNKYVEESDALLEHARHAGSLVDEEVAVLGPLLEHQPLVVHLQSGDGRDDLDLAARGARLVVGVDFSEVTATAASRRATELGRAVDYVVADATQVSLSASCADLVYTGKGALMWLGELASWATEVARLLKPEGWLYVFEAHPAAPLWSRDEDTPRIDQSTNYFGGTRVNDTFPASAMARFGDEATPEAVEHQWPLSDILNALIIAGLSIAHLGEHPEPFWRPQGARPAAWEGARPNTFSVLARKVDR